MWHTVVEGFKSCLCVLIWRSLLFEHCGVSCVEGGEMKAGCLYISDRNLEERINFKISVSLGKSISASCAMLLEVCVCVCIYI
jgi:hypothetical protein